MNDLLQDMMKRRMARLEEINRTSIRITAGLAAFNAKLIFRNANAKLPADAKIPDSDLEHFAALLLEGVGGDSKGDSGGDGG